MGRVLGRETMTAVHLTGHGGLDMLEVRDDVPVPSPGPDEVLVGVTAAGMNNTDINTRTGWYDEDSGGWAGALSFPRIQGADAVGRIAAVGSDVDPDRVGERVVCDPYLRDPADRQRLDGVGFLGSERDGAFAQYLCLPATNAHSVPDGLDVPDAALATLPCSGGTAMNMLLLAGAEAGDLALVTGASGGVGTFLVQVLKALGAEVVAVAGASKHHAVAGLGADHVVDRDSQDPVGDVLAATGGRRPSLVADVVGGAAFATHLELLRRGGRYVVAGAIAGPVVELDLRKLYLKSLSFFGSSVYLPAAVPRVVDLVAGGRLVPVVSRTWPLREIRQAQTAFADKRHVGSFVLLPPL